MFTTIFETLIQIKKIANQTIEVLNSTYGYFIPFGLIIISVAINSYFDPYGGITLDAPWYLKLSQSIADDKGFNVLSPDYQFYFDYHFFHLWPPLYPLCIGLLSKLTSIPIWFSFKLVNLIFIFFAFRKIHKYFNQYSLVFLSLFFGGYMLDMYYQCWSEVPLICVFSLYFIELQKLQISNNVTIKNIIKLSLYNLVLVGIRYQAIIAILGLAVFAIKFYKQRDFKNFKYLVWTCIFLFIVEVVFIYANYFIWNKIHYNVPLDFSVIKDIIATISIQFFNQINFLFCQSITAWFLLPISIIAAYILYSKTIIKKTGSFYPNALAISVGCMGILYITLPILMRANNAIGIAHYRFYSVAIFCLFWSILSIYIYSKRIHINIYLILFMCVSFFINTFGKNYYIAKVKNIQNFASRFEEINKKYSHIPDKSIVVFADKWIEFIRPEIESISPYENIMGDLSLPIDSFIAKLKLQPKDIYIEVIKKEDLRVKRYHKSVELYMQKHQAEEFVKITSSKNLKLNK